LSKLLDNYSSGPFPTAGSYIGGTLRNITSTGYDSWINFYTYTLTFAGYERERPIYLITKSNSSIPYEIGKFYKFDPANIRGDGELAGSFIDDNLNLMIPVSC
jgi:hypothetical protein